MAIDMNHVLEQTQRDGWWLPQDVQIVDRPEITYTHSPRPSSMYNNVVRLRASDTEHSRLVDEVLQAHAQTQSEWRLSNLSRNDELERCLENCGYDLRSKCIAYTLPVGAPRPQPPDNVVVRHVQTRQGLIDMYATAEQVFGKPVSTHTEEDLAHFLADSVGPNARCHRFVAYDTNTNEPLCAAAFNSYNELGFGFLWGGGTVAHARGRGVYSAIMTARIQHAKKLGLSHVGLYAITTTSAPIVAAQEFDAHGTLHFWLRPAPETPATP